MKKLPLLGGLDAAAFLRDYWQKKPLLIRQAIPDFQGLLSREALFALAARDDIESRLIQHGRNKWKMDRGPIDQVPPLAQKNWTLLVQGVNLHDDAVDALMRQFDFVPDTRLDDLMISYATKDGGVGAHFDSYDVFLLQASGHRRWRIGAQQDLTLAQGLPLKILANFQPEQEFVLGPGDMLYLPPQYAHEGVALDECMTYSIGFRAPSYQELGEAFLASMMDTIELPGRYADPDLRVPRRRAEIDNAMLAKVGAELRQIRFTREDILLFLGEYLSEPKPHVFFDPPARLAGHRQFAQDARKKGVRLSRKTQMLHRDNHVFINGTSFEADGDDLAMLKVLADARRLETTAVTPASQELEAALYDWYGSGWLLLGSTP